MIRSIVLIGMLFTSVVGFSCMNELAVIKGIGISTVRRNAWELIKPTVEKTELANYILGAEKMCGEELGCSDLVIAYFYVGEFKKALDLSTRLVAKFPRKYEVVMTHAAALELNGNFKEALRYIEKGMAINPSSHENSEWIHVAILKDRIAGGKANSILGFDFGNGDYPVLPAAIKNKRQTLEQLSFQLTERYYFIPKSDRQFGVLLYEYANLLYLNNFKTASREYYDMASEYGFHPPISRAYTDTSAVQANMKNNLLNASIQFMTRLERKPEEKIKKPRLFMPALLTMGFLGCIVLVVFWRRRKPQI